VFRKSVDGKLKYIIISIQPWGLDMRSDETTTINELRTAVADFVRNRNWESFHTPKNLAMSIAIEAAELMEHFQWLNGTESGQNISDSEEKFQVGDELADILIYCLAFANRAEIDISQAITNKMSRNEQRYPGEASPPAYQHQV
jgi:dCTP diphosphatase